MADPSRPLSHRLGRALMLGAAGVAVLLLAIQLVPYGRDHPNPVVRAEPDWDSPRTRELVRRACYDCHSNETAWPWYASVAPASWLVLHDVEEGRAVLNFSEWDRTWEEAHEAAEVVEEGEMPLWYYLAAHPEARLTEAEHEALVRGLQATLGDRAAEAAHD